MLDAAVESSVVSFERAEGGPRDGKSGGPAPPFVSGQLDGVGHAVDRHVGRAEREPPVIPVAADPRCNLRRRANHLTGAVAGPAAALPPSGPLVGDDQAV